MQLRLDPTAARVLVRVEGAAALALSFLLYAALEQSWWLFAGLFLAPDLALLGYLANPKLGSRAYNALHTYVLPGALFALGFVSGRGAWMAVAFIWAAHIGLDRALGLGFKYPGRPFRETHVQRI